MQALDKVIDFFYSTKVPDQVADVDIALFTNPWFLVPFVALMGWWIYKQAFKDIAVVLIILGVWYVSGTPYMETLIVNGELQINKVLPVMFGGAAVLAFIVYLFIIK